MVPFNLIVQVAPAAGGQRSGRGGRHAGVRDQRRRLLGTAGAGRAPRRTSRWSSCAPPDLTHPALARCAWPVPPLSRRIGHDAQVSPSSSHAQPEPWIADLHIHSKYSRACSRDLELENLAWWAQRKGITLLGTGDFTHPGWYDHLRENLRPAEPGLLPARRRPRGARSRGGCRRACAGRVRFMLSVEISTIYKRDDRTRKVHHLIYLPDLAAVARFNARLGHGPGGLGGNLGSDGRPILGLDSRDLLEITLEASPDGFLVPAHIWTPWFSALGSKSGFDAIADCYADLAGHIRAVETGLSSDPEMNWRVASLDAYQLVSNSDAHSPQALAREATAADDRAGLLLGQAGAGDRRRSTRDGRVLPGGGQVPRRRASRRVASAGIRPGPARPAASARSAASRSRSACCTGSRSWPTGRSDYRPGATAAVRPTSSSSHQILGEIRRRRRARARASKPGSPLSSPRSGSELDILHTGADRGDRPGRRRTPRRGGRAAASRPGAPHARVRRRVRRHPPLRPRRAADRGATGD